MRIFDSHCHPQFSQYNSDRDEVIRRALQKEVGMICVGTDLHTSRQAIELTDVYEGLWASIGLHPNDELDKEYEEEEYKRLTSHSKVVAIGEIGLDYHRTSEEKRPLQKDRFLKQLVLARQLGLPVIIHCRDAHDDMLDLLRGSEVRGVLHSFTGTATQAAAFVDIGLFIGFSGIITFTEQYNEAVQITPPERILVETDAPFLTPIPYRGRRNEPQYVFEIAKKVALLKDLSIDTFIKTSKDNTCVLFHIPG